MTTRRSLMPRIIVALAFMVLLAGCGTVDPDERAIFIRWGTIDEKCYQPGFYTYFPIGVDMDIIKVGVQAFPMAKMGAATKDIQEIHADVIVNYSLDGSACHEMFKAGQAGHSYREKVLAPALQDALKAGTAHFAIDEIIQNRERLRVEVTKALQVRVKPYYINVPDSGVNLVNFDVSAAYMKSVEAKQIQQQMALQEGYKVEQAKRTAESFAATAKGAADAARETAKGKADALRIEAQAQAEYNQKVSASLTPILVQQEWIAAWKAGGSHVPSVLADGKSGFLLQLTPQAPARKE